MYIENGGAKSHKYIYIYICVHIYLETLLARIFAFWLCAPEFRLNHKITPVDKKNAWHFQKRRNRVLNT